jgi:hypothetical protein
MKIASLIAAASLTISTLAAADQSAVQFEVVLSRDGNVVASPKVVAEFGKTVAIRTADLKFEGSASAPDKNGNSLTAVRLELVENGATRQLKEMSMLADLGNAPSFAIAVPETNARFMVRAKRVKLPG